MLSGVFSGNLVSIPKCKQDFIWVFVTYIIFELYLKFVPPKLTEFIITVGKRVDF